MVVDGGGEALISGDTTIVEAPPKAVTPPQQDVQMFWDESTGILVIQGPDAFKSRTISFLLDKTDDYVGDDIEVVFDANGVGAISFQKQDAFRTVNVADSTGLTNPQQAVFFY